MAELCISAQLTTGSINFLQAQPKGKQGQKKPETVKKLVALQFCFCFLPKNLCKIINEKLGLAFLFALII